MVLMPSVIEESGRGLKSFNLVDKLFDENIIILENEINDDLATAIKTQLLYLDSKEECKEIDIYISSGGGSVLAGNGIIDVIQHINTPVNTVCTGMIASMGTQIFASATGARRIMPRSRIMIHSVASSAAGKIQNLRIEMEETEYLQEQLMNDLADFTKGKTSYEEICKLTERDNWLSAQEAIEIGIGDEIVK